MTNSHKFLVHIKMLLYGTFTSLLATASGGTSVDEDKGKRVVDVDKEEKEEEKEDWFTADEGVFDEQLGRWVVSPAMIERIKRREKEKADSEVKSATKLRLQFDLDEVMYMAVP